MSFEPVNISPEQAEQWDEFAEYGTWEVIPDELPEVGGLEYVAMPADLPTPPYVFGGYDAYDSDTNTTRSLVIVGAEIPKHVRGLIAGHLFMHKVFHDDGAPVMCTHLDRAIQSVVADAEPSLLEPFYEHNEKMYAVGIQGYMQRRQKLNVEIDRYQKGLKNATAKHEKAVASDDMRKRLQDAGLILPNGELALTGVDKRNGLRTHISLQTEHGTKHRCRDCSHPITKGSQRITTATTQKSGGYDHHHYHVGCFSHIEVGVFGTLQQVGSNETS